jgi:hypothetical protein
MKTKSFGLIVGVILGGEQPALAASTTYNYVAHPYDQNCGCDQSYTAFGSRMLGGVTFNFDTSCVSGFYYVSDSTVTNIKLKSGNYSSSGVANVATFGSSYFIFQNGAIVSWDVDMAALPLSRSLPSHLFTTTFVDEVAFGEPFIAQVSVHDKSGTWTRKAQPIANDCLQHAPPQTGVSVTK